MYKLQYLIFFNDKSESPYLSEHIVLFIIFIL